MLIIYICFSFNGLGTRRFQKLNNNLLNSSKFTKQKKYYFKNIIKKTLSIFKTI
jgi:hypothetical protein